jgi:hypothetical protein
MLFNATRAVADLEVEVVRGPQACPKVAMAAVHKGLSPPWTNQNGKLFSTSQSTSMNASGLNSRVVGKVRTSCCAHNCDSDRSVSSVTGILKGYDQLLNLVLDDVEELLQGLHICRPEMGSFRR